MYIRRDVMLQNISIPLSTLFKNATFGPPMPEYLYTLFKILTYRTFSSIPLNFPRSSVMKVIETFLKPARETSVIDVVPTGVIVQRFQDKNRILSHLCLCVKVVKG